MFFGVAALIAAILVAEAREFNLHGKVKCSIQNAPVVTRLELWEKDPENDDFKESRVLLVSPSRQPKYSIHFEDFEFGDAAPYLVIIHDCIPEMWNQKGQKSAKSAFCYVTQQIAIDSKDDDIKLDVDLVGGYNSGAQICTSAREFSGTFGRTQPTDADKPAHSKSEESEEEEIDEKAKKSEESKSEESNGDDDFPDENVETTTTAAKTTELVYQHGPDRLPGAQPKRHRQTTTPGDVEEPSSDEDQTTPKDLDDEIIFGTTTPKPRKRTTRRPTKTTTESHKDDDDDDFPDSRKRRFKKVEFTEEDNDWIGVYYRKYANAHKAEPPKHNLTAAENDIVALFFELLANSSKVDSKATENEVENSNVAKALEELREQFNAALVDDVYSTPQKSPKADPQQPADTASVSKSNASEPSLLDLAAASLFIIPSSNSSKAEKPENNTESEDDGVIAYWTGVFNNVVFGNSTEAQTSQNATEHDDADGVIEYWTEVFNDAVFGKASSTEAQNATQSDGAVSESWSFAAVVDWFRDLYHSMANDATNATVANPKSRPYSILEEKQGTSNSSLSDKAADLFTQMWAMLPGVGGQTDSDTTTASPETTTAGKLSEEPKVAKARTMNEKPKLNFETATPSTTTASEE